MRVNYPDVPYRREAPRGTWQIRTTTSYTTGRAGADGPRPQGGTTTGGAVGDGNYVPALDGIRAIAVLGVLLFHFGVTWLAGGLLGVDVFFVLSGFLITALLLQEKSSTGTLNFGRFYARRAKRLLPALLLMILLVAVYAGWYAEPDTLPSIRSDVLSTVGYFSNWHFIFTHQSYFQRFGPPSPVLHTWSLAVEEQFYLAWPAVTWLVLRRYRRRGLAVAAGVGVVGSFASTFILSLGAAGTTRLYYGTDVRVQELMAGALLAILRPAVSGWLQRRQTAASRPASASWIVGGAGLVGLIWMFHAVSGNGPFLYRGGFLLVAAATVGLIAVSVYEPGHPVARALALPPVRYVGRISYGLYLYHYPLFLLLDSRRVGISGSGLLLIRLAATFAVAVASFHLVELPVRNGRLIRRRSAPRRLLLGVPAGAALAVTAIVLATTLPSSSLSGSVSAASARSAASMFAVPRTPPPGLTGVHRVRVLLLGDSMAMTLGVGLGRDAGAWGVDIINHGAIGCDLDWTQTVNFQNQTDIAAQGCKDWPTVWKGLIEQYRPDVVAILLGRFEYQNRLMNGRWYTVGQAPWDRLITSRMQQAIKLVSSDGARVAMLTLPYVTQTTNAPNGQPWDVNQPSRTRAWNADVRRAAAAFPGVASVVDLNRMIDPGDRYTSYIDGVRVRDYDNEHFSLAGGLYLRPFLLPAFVTLGREGALSRTA